MTNDVFAPRMSSCAYHCPIAGCYFVRKSVDRSFSTRETQSTQKQKNIKGETENLDLIARKIPELSSLRKEKKTKLALDCCETSREFSQHPTLLQESP